MELKSFDEFVKIPTKITEKVQPSSYRIMQIVGGDEAEGFAAELAGMVWDIFRGYVQLLPSIDKGERFVVFSKQKLSQSDLEELVKENFGDEE